MTNPAFAVQPTGDPRKVSPPSPACADRSSGRFDLVRLEADFLRERRRDDRGPRPRVEEHLRFPLEPVPDPRGNEYRASPLEGAGEGSPHSMNSIPGGTGGPVNTVIRQTPGFLSLMATSWISSRLLL